MKLGLNGAPHKIESVSALLSRAVVRVICIVAKYFLRFTPNPSSFLHTGNEKFARLETYFQTHGSCVVPTNYSDGNGTDLANWVAKQRQIHAQGRMTHERYEKLQAIQFVWRIKQYSTKEKDRDSTREDQKWTEKYERLVAFQKEFGTCAVRNAFATRNMAGSASL